MLSCRFVTAVLAAFIVTSKATSWDALSDEFINYINSNQTLWRAGRNFHQDTPSLYLKRLSGSLKDNGLDYIPEKRYRNLTRIPEKFDARKKWSRCPSLRQIRDQGSCGSCWAVAAVSALTDRFCIASKGRNHFYFSEDDVISCCTNCGAGCNGGLLSTAWNYSKRIGTVSGGTFHSYQGCKPYEIAPCEHDVPGYRPSCSYASTPRCRKACQSKYKKDYFKDKKKTGVVYKLKEVRTIQMDIMKLGPVTTSFKMYSDFLHYKGGVYRHVSGKEMGGHSIKLLGWGVEDGVKYWIVANSWNTDWGDGGFFKIVRGEDHLGVESNAVAGYVRPKKYHNM